MGNLSAAQKEQMRGVDDFAAWSLPQVQVGVHARLCGPCKHRCVTPHPLGSVHLHEPTASHNRSCRKLLRVLACPPRTMSVTAVIVMAASPRCRLHLLTTTKQTRHPKSATLTWSPSSSPGGSFLSSYCWRPAPMLCTALSAAAPRSHLVACARASVFTDMSELTTRGIFRLPVKTFNYFQRRPEDLHIMALEVLLVLALFCKGDQDKKLEFCFRVFGMSVAGSL